MAVRTPIIAIVGRPNVGKSTLFNRILGVRRAVVEDVAGVTRDRNYALIERFSVPFYLIDSGGFEKEPADELQQRVVEQALLAAEEADLVVALFDGQAGCSEGDRDVVDLLRRFDKPVIFSVNKCDGLEQEHQTADFYSLGLDEFFPFSALHGRRVNEFVEEMLGRLPNYRSLKLSVEAREVREEEAARALERLVEEEPLDDELESESEAETDAELVEDTESGVCAAVPQFAPVFVPGESSEDELEYDRAHKVLSLDQSVAAEVPELARQEELFEIEDAPIEKAVLDCISVAIVGRPNVGKSTLLNTLTGERRAITSSVAGTTRDALDLKIRREGQDFLLIDTAGLRKKARVSDNIEKYSTMRALRVLGDCDVALVLIDAERGPQEQDAKIVGLAHEQGKGIVILVNKWDLVEKDHKVVKRFKDEIREVFKFAPYAPMLFVSAKTGKRCPKVIEAIRDVAYERVKRVSTNRLNQVLARAIDKMKPNFYRGRPVKLYYGTQVEASPPRFLLFFNYPRAIHFSYLRYLKNAIRDEFGFSGTDIKLVTKKR